MMKTLYSLVCMLGLAAGCFAAEPVALHWLSGSAPEVEQGVSFGVPWPEGAVAVDAEFTLKSADGTSLPVTSRPLAYWPDGSLKWSGHAALAAADFSDELTISVGKPAAPAVPLSVGESGDVIKIDTGRLSCLLNTSGETLFQTLEINGQTVGGGLRPVGYVQNKPSDEIVDVRSRILTGRVLSAEVEQSSGVRAVVKVSGEYTGGFSKDGIVPFSARLYFYAGSPELRIVYTIIYEGDMKQDYIRGLGLTMDVPLRENMFNRHVLFAGADEGVWHEPVRLFAARTTRLDPNKDEILQNQLNGQPLLDPAEYGEKRAKVIADIAEWGGYKLVQHSADSFEVRKRTSAESCWLKSDWGSRSRGAAFAGDTSGGMVWSLRDFWQTNPSGFEISGMTTDSGTMTLWLWPPDGPAMDLRHYSTKGHGLNAAYEDYEEGHATPYGVARSFEMTLRAMPAVPSNEAFSALADAAVTPALPVCAPEYYHSVPVFGCWSLPDSSTPSKKWLEDKLQLLLDYEMSEIENRRWYGFWDYGDVMHQYDPIRHQWKYDIGGFAWANTELAPNLWLWVSFLRTGDADVFRMAEAMTHHTSEVDMYHTGPMRGHGSRHNVSHWGAGAKELRISQAIFHRPYYYLTADERTGDIMASVADSEQALVRVNPLRKVAPKTDWPTQSRIGPDWFSLAGNWFVAWERTGDDVYREKIVTGMDSILALPYQLFTGPYMNYNPETGEFGLINGKATAARSHMQSIFGGAELMFEVVEEVNHPEWNQAWLEYSERYTWTDEEWRAAGEEPPAPGAFPVWHARLAAYASQQKKDPALAARAWSQLWMHADHDPGSLPTVPVPYGGSVALNPGAQMAWGAINHSSQWSLNVIEVLELVGDSVPEEMPGEGVK